MSFPQSEHWPRSGESLDAVERILAELAPQRGTLGAAAGYFADQPGKRVRVRLCLDLAGSLRLPREDGMMLAAAVELLHGASLVLDDVQDNDEVRRDRPSVWRRYGRNQAMNLGIHLIAQSFALAARLPGISPFFADALRDATAGQSAEFDFRNGIPTLASYFAMAQEKTGALFSLPAQAAAAMVQLPCERVSEIGALFAQLGAAYQIQDDLADALGLKDRARAGLDLREGKVNSVMIFHLELKPGDRAPFLAFQRDRAARANDVQLDLWLDRLAASGSLTITQDHLRKLCGEIINDSSTVPTPFGAHAADLAMGISDPTLLHRERSETASRLAL